MSNASSVGKIMAIKATCHFKTPGSNENDLETRKLGAVRVKIERRWWLTLKKENIFQYDPL